LSFDDFILWEKKMFTLSSPMFSPGHEIPKQYTGEGENSSPPLKWSDTPRQAQELAIVCDDPDAPQTEPWVHWVIYGLSPTIRGIPENILPKQQIDQPLLAKQGLNSAGQSGYTGPMPPKGHGWHRYFFKLYALDTRLDTPPGATKHELESAMKGHILGEAQLIGKYKR
jgi:Raf kinase inhibitor-like YbhB/YbcL family protein